MISIEKNRWTPFPIWAWVCDQNCLKNLSVSEAIENEAKEQKSGFLSMLIGTLGASLLGNLLSGKSAQVIQTRDTVTQVGDWTIRVGQNC